MHDDEMRLAEQAAANEQAEAAYAELLAAGQDSDEAVSDLLEAFPLPTRPEGFVIDNDGAADWALRRIGQAEARMRRDAATVRAEQERWNTWQAKRDEQNQATIDRFQSMLSAYYDQLKASGMLPRNSRSYRLPHGVLQARLHEIQWERKEAEILAWAKAVNGADLVEVRESLRWAEVKKRIGSERNEIGAPAIDMGTGEYVPGLQVGLPARDVFQAKADLG
ncbi:MAG: host-nuclease inhibitor Gam family protein [Pseudomonas sp.]|nr:host-nuclease inhibitor Gam family protein [Pseudomonas sp.]